MASSKNIERRPSTVNIPVPGSLNTDATESSMPKGDFLELRNYRKPHNDVVEVRSGYKKTIFAENSTPVGAAEYRLDDSYVNVLFYDHLGELRARIYDGDRSPELNVMVPIVAEDAFPVGGYQVQAIQFDTFMVLSVYDVGVFALFPTATDLTAWQVREIGKELSPAPDSISFAAKVNGDLIVNQYVIPIPNGGTDCKPLYGNAQNEAIKTRLPIAAPYFLARDSGTDGVNIQKTNLIKQFEPETASANASDGSSHLQSGTTQRALGTKYHIQKRGWFYKFLAKSQYIDIRGQKITYYHEVSVDIFVPDNNYAPPFILNDDGGSTYSSLHNLNDVGTAWLTSFSKNSGSGITVIPSLPAGASPLTVTDPDFLELIKKYRAYFHSVTTSDDNGTADPFDFTSRVLGKYTLNAVGISFFYQFPYKLSVPASELLGSPQTVFDWSNFSNLPADTIEIEIYRTAHTDSAQFAPNVYGLAGTITKPGSSGSSSFTDSTPDWNLEYDGKTSSEVGYLQGEFSGKVIRVYNNNIRLGDTVSILNIRKPSKLVQAFAFDEGDITVLLTKSDLTGTAYDGLPPVAFSYQYADNNGYVSELTTFPVDVTGAADSTVGVAFTFPHGYNDTITNIYVFEGRVVGGVRVWRRARGQDGNLAIDVKDGHLIYPGYLGWNLMPVAADADHIKSKDRGACIWTEESDMFFWPQENFEREHDFAPVTHIGNVVGPALVLTDSSQVQTTFGVDNRWEVVSDGVGSIGRQCALKIGRPVFYLSSGGLNITEGYGIRPFPAATQELIRSYLLEEIPGQPSMANASRASFGWLERRKELWVRIPSSVDLGGTMPAVTIVYQFFLDYGTYSPKDAQNYTFDIIPDDPGTPVYFISSARGRLFAFMGDPSNTRMLFIDCDVATAAWDSDAYFTMPVAMGMTDVLKELEGVSMTYDRDCFLEIATGMRRTDGVETDITHGLLDPACAIFEEPQPAAKFRQPFNVPIGKNIEDIEDWMPCIRVHTKPNEFGAHLCRVQAFSIKLAEKEDAFVTHS